MPFLIVFRHGKSDWEADYGDDHDRPLSRRGVKAAEVMGAWLANRRLVPDRALTSSARRARETLELASQTGAWHCPIEVRTDLYGATASEVVTLLQKEHGSTARLLITGHEPTSSQLVSLLVGGGSIRMPTAAMAGIELGNVPWAQVGAASGRLAWLQIPRLLS